MTLSDFTFGLNFISKLRLETKTQLKLEPACNSKVAAMIHLKLALSKVMCSKEEETAEPVRCECFY